MKLLKVRVVKKCDDDKQMRLAFSKACLAAGVKTKESPNVFYKQFTKLSKRAPGPNGGKRYYTKQWPYIKFEFRAPNTVIGHAQLEDISGLTGYQPDKGRGYNIKFKDLQKEFDASNISTIISKYVQGVLDKWNSLKGYKD